MFIDLVNKDITAKLNFILFFSLITIIYNYPGNSCSRIITF